MNIYSPTSRTCPARMPIPNRHIHGQGHYRTPQRNTKQQHP
ncbi:hypothetical protein [Vibrio rhodolitus]|nr:hypothetical protein [Vibrio rhodolitus]